METLIERSSLIESLDPDPLTERSRETWMSGDFGRIAAGYERGAAEFIARLGLSGTHRVLDVACGTGNLAIPPRVRERRSLASISRRISSRRQKREPRAKVSRSTSRSEMPSDFGTPMERSIPW